MEAEDSVPLSRGRAGQQETKPWERLPQESAPAFRAFLAYLEAGPDRALGRTARQIGKSVSLLKRWSARHGWQTRVRAYDDRQQQVAKDDARRVREAAYRRRTEHAAQLERIAMAGLRTLLVRDPESGELRFDSRLKPTDVAALIRAACQLLPAVEPGPETGEEEGPELGHLSTQELQLLLAMLPGGHQEQDTEDSDDSN